MSADLQQHGLTDFYENSTIVIKISDCESTGYTEEMHTVSKNGKEIKERRGKTERKKGYEKEDRKQEKRERKGRKGKTKKVRKGKKKEAVKQSSERYN
jgi:hypothetical protein